MIATAFCEFTALLASSVRIGDAQTCSVGHFPSNRNLIVESLRYSTLQSVPDYLGDAKDNRKPMLVRKRTMLDQSMSSCTVLGESGVPSCWGYRFACCALVRHYVSASFLQGSVLYMQGLLFEVLWMGLGSLNGLTRQWLRRLPFRFSGEMPGGWESRMWTHHHLFQKVD